MIAVYNAFRIANRISLNCDHEVKFLDSPIHLAWQYLSPLKVISICYYNLQYNSGGFMGGYKYSKRDTNILIYLYPRGYKYFKIFVWGDTNILKYLYGGIQNLGGYKYFMTPAPTSDPKIRGRIF